MRIRRYFALFLALAAAPFIGAQAARPWYASRLEALGFELYDSPPKAPEIQVEALTGGTARLADFKGKLILLNFWATWCPPCKAEMPSLQVLWDRTKSKDFVLLATSVGERRETVRAFIEKNKYSFPVFMDASGKAGMLYGASAIPTTVLIDKEGRAIAYAVGGREYSSPEALALFAELASR